jgi:hypothetical protein
MPTIVGIDPGNSTTIGYYEQGKGQSTSVVIPSEIAAGSLLAFEQTHQRSPKTQSEEHVMEHDGASVYVGKLATQQSAWSSAALGDNTRYWNGHAKRLILAALAALGITGDDPIHLATGMPFVLWKDKEHQKRMITSLKGTHQITYNGNERSFRIDRVLVLPEAGAALAALPSRNGTSPESERAILDIGGRTIDGYYARAGQPVIARCFSDVIGLQDIKALLQDRISTRARALAGHELDSIIYAASVKHTSMPVVYHAGQQIDYTSELDAAIREVASRIASRASQAWGNGLHTGALAGAAAQVDLIGGGARLFAGVLQQHMPHAVLAGEPHMANVHGYYRAAVEKWGKA